MGRKELRWRAWFRFRNQDWGSGMTFVLAKAEGDLLQEVIRFRAKSAPNRSMAILE